MNLTWQFLMISRKSIASTLALFTGLWVAMFFIFDSFSPITIIIIFTSAFFTAGFSFLNNGQFIKRLKLMPFQNKQFVQQLYVYILSYVCLIFICNALTWLITAQFGLDQQFLGETLSLMFATYVATFGYSVKQYLKNPIEKTPTLSLMLLLFFIVFFILTLAISMFVPDNTLFHPLFLITPSCSLGVYWICYRDAVKHLQAAEF